MPPHVLTLAASFACSALAAQTQLRERELDPLVTWEIDAVDIDRDGDLDVALVVADGVTIYWNDGIGGLERTNVLPTPLASTAAGAFGDLDGDGDVDALFASPDLLSCWLVRNAGGRAMNPERLVLTASGGRPRVCLGDMDGDGDLDIVGASAFTETYVYFNQGNGSFSGRANARHAFNQPGPLQPVDLDGDGDLDIACVDNLSSELVLLFNDGSGTLTAQTSSLGDPGEGAAGHAADFDGDGIVDLVTSHGSSGNQFWKGPTFSAGEPLAPTGQLFAIAAADFDLDGDLDIVGSPNNFFGAALEFWLNDGSGGFVDAFLRVSASDGGGTSIATGDLDGDGDPEVVLGRRALIFPAVDKLWINHHVQLASPRRAARGSSVRLDLAWQPGYNAGLSIALPVAGIERTLPTPTPFGALYLESSGAVNLPMISLPPRGGVGQLFVPVPMQPNLVGLEFGIQALLYDVLGGLQPRLTGLQRLRIE